MVFKQKTLLEEKFKFSVVLIGNFFMFLVILIYCLVNGEKFKYICALIFLFLFLFVPIILVGFRYLEYFYIYDDRIEARNIFGIKNVVYFRDVVFVEEKKINLTTRGGKKSFYLFKDGRKNNNNSMNIDSCYNNKKYSLRIYKTQELELYIKDVLNLPIKEQLDSKYASILYDIYIVGKKEKELDQLKDISKSTINRRHLMGLALMED